MTLPTVETPRYELTLPSTDKVVQFRPFLVKEEKVLLVAMESNNANEIMNATRDSPRNRDITTGNLGMTLLLSSRTVILQPEP